MSGSWEPSPSQPRTNLARANKEQDLREWDPFSSASMQGISSGRGWDRTSDPSRVNRSTMLSRVAVSGLMSLG